MTKTITVSQVVASVTATYSAHNSTLPGPTAVGTTSTTVAVGTGGSSTTAAAPSHTSQINSASALNSLYAGSAGVLVMVAAALL
jgi:hypothetical protein